MWGVTWSLLSGLEEVWGEESLWQSGHYWEAQQTSLTGLEGRLYSQYWAACEGLTDSLYSEVTINWDDESQRGSAHAQLMLLMDSRGMWRVTHIIDSSSICNKNPHTIEEYLWKSGRANDKFDCGCKFYLLISPVFLLRRYTVPYTVAVRKGAEYDSHENQDQAHHHQQRSYQPEQTNTFQTNTPDSSTQL